MFRKLFVKAWARNPGDYTKEEGMWGSRDSPIDGFRITHIRTGELHTYTQAEMMEWGLPYIAHGPPAEGEG